MRKKETVESTSYMRICKIYSKHTQGFGVCSDKAVVQKVKTISVCQVILILI